VKRVLVTGGAGFIGSHLCEKLTGLGCSVRVVDALDDAYDPLLKEENLKSLEVEFLRGDIRDPDLMQRACAGIDAVFHLAARAGVRDSLLNPALYASVNVEGTVRVLEAAGKAGVGRVLVASSSSVYGSRKNELFSETDVITRPESPYAASKAAAELFGYSWQLQTKIPLVFTRLFTVYGPRQRPNMAMQRFAGQLKAGEAVTLFGDGSSLRDYTFVADAVQGLLLALGKAEQFHVVNLAGGHPVPLLQVVETMARLLQRELKVRFLPEQAGDVPETRADLRLAREWLGYAPKVGLEEGLRQFLDRKGGRDAESAE
jgi:UDP-glucuronate 4-epimerase